MCGNCTGGSNDITFIIIVIIFAAIAAKFLGATPEGICFTVAGALGIVLALRMILKNSEHLETLRPVDDDMIQSDGIENYNYDNNRWSEYGNISMTRDIDSMEQRPIDLELGGDFSDLDNSDVVEDAVEKHSSNFQPDQAHGFSSTNSAYLSNMTLGEQNPNGNKPLYTVPLNDAAYDLDESLSRGQQYRASINKRAIDGAVRNTRNTFQKVFMNELDENEKRVWYSAEAQDMETDFHPYY